MGPFLNTTTACCGNCGLPMCDCRLTDSLREERDRWLALGEPVRRPYDIEPVIEGPFPLSRLARLVAWARKQRPVLHLLKGFSK